MQSGRPSGAQLRGSFLSAPYRQRCGQTRKSLGSAITTELHARGRRSTAFTSCASQAGPRIGTGVLVRWRSFGQTSLNISSRTLVRPLSDEDLWQLISPALKIAAGTRAKRVLCTRERIAVMQRWQI